VGNLLETLPADFPPRQMHAFRDLLVRRRVLEEASTRRSPDVANTCSTPTDYHTGSTLGEALRVPYEPVVGGCYNASETYLSAEFWNCSPNISAYMAHFFTWYPAVMLRGAIHVRILIDDEGDGEVCRSEITSGDPNPPEPREV